MNAEIELAGIKLRIQFRLPETIAYFQNFVTEQNCNDWDIRVEDKDIPRYPLICPTGILDPFSEAYLLMPKASAFLLKYNRVLMHGVAFVFRGKSWLITAPSGTGKTTQLRHWQHLYGNEIEIINGDKTVMACKENGSFWLYPSPWTGKEKDTGSASAELGGIIVLQQAENNTIYRLSPRESVLLIFQQFLNIGDESEEVRRMGKLESKLLDSIPVWMLENIGDEESAELAHQTFVEYEALKYENF